MKQTTFNYIKEILKDYPDVEKYIEKREEELRYPFRENDLNADIKGNSSSNHSMTNMMITIEQDRRLCALKRNRDVIKYNLENCDEETNKIVNELYIARYPKYTMRGLVDNNIIYCSLRKAYDLRNKFFEHIADDLNLNK